MFPSGVIMNVLSFPETPIIISPFVSLFLIIKSWLVFLVNNTPLGLSESLNLIPILALKFLWICNNSFGWIIPPIPTLELLLITKVRLLWL